MRDISNKTIGTDRISLQYRNKAVNLKDKKLLMTDFRGSEQEQDFQNPPNCRGYGRIRHFHSSTSENWPENPLPIEPARKSLKLPKTDTIRAQIFQNAVCNWRCWYCYVPFDLLRANQKQSSWLSVDQLLDYYLEQQNPPQIIDLSGGQPDLTPEWVPWFMSELASRKLDSQIYLWSDDNLSNDYFWRYLTKSDIDLIRSYKNYGRVCCFKGFDDESFSFNTSAEPALYDRQFDLMKKLLTLGIDVYAYVTLTTPNSIDLENKIAHFVDRLQQIDHLLPLKTIPLEITVYSPVKSRMNQHTDSAISNQHLAIKHWNRELDERFSSHEKSLSICDFKVGVVQ